MAVAHLDKLYGMPEALLLSSSLPPILVHNPRNVSSATLAEAATIAGQAPKAAILMC